MESREDLKQDIENLEEFCAYMRDLFCREGQREDIGQFCIECLYSMMICAETDLTMKKKQYMLDLKDILDDKNEWED